MQNHKHKKNNVLNELTREKKMVSDGRDRYLKRLEKHKSISIQKNPHKLVEEALQRVSEELGNVIKKEDEKLQDTFTSNKSHLSKWYSGIKSIDLDLLAYIGLTTCMDGVSNKFNIAKVLTTIGKRVMMENYSIELKAFNPDLAKRLETKVKRDHSSTRVRETSLKYIAKKEGFDFKTWSESQRATVASPVYNAVMQCSDIFDVWTQFKNKKTVKRIGLTQEASDKLANLDFVASWKEAMAQPMIVQPKDHTSYDTGCYLDEALSSEITLVRSPYKGHRKAVERAFDDGSILPTIYALNAIQRTEYTINNPIVDAVEWCWLNDKSFGKFPRRKQIDQKKRPENWDDLNSSDKKGWTISARKVIVKNREIDGLRAVMSQDLASAKELQDYDKFWLPHNLDFRGRVYPIPHFNHHRDDHIKAMFTFANGDKIGKEGARWLAIHLATVGDFDKVSKKSFDERVEWVIDNEPMITKIGTDYQSTFEIWSQADKPFQFLASCIEFVGYLKNGEDYICSLPIALDASNSGTQHYSASSRSRDDGLLVNLIPTKKPQDIYQAVADKVLEAINVDLEKQCPLARMWLDFGVTRKTVKRNTMTYGYSSEKFGFKNQIMEDTMRGLSDKVLTGELKEHPFGDDDGFSASKYLADKNWTAINEVISSASVGMKFFKDLTTLTNEQSKPMQWTTPMGFPVISRYADWATKSVKIYLFDREAKVLKRSTVKISERPTDVINKSKSKSAIAPNIIHSMDASHLLKTVLISLENNISDFSLIHDSFATIPSKTSSLFKIIRIAFVEMYENFDLYENILEDTKKNLENSEDITFPNLPPKGKLDLKQVLNSDYCFA